VEKPVVKPIGRVFRDNRPLKVGGAKLLRLAVWNYSEHLMFLIATERVGGV